MKKIILAMFFVVVVGCSGPADNAQHPVERGLSYVSGAIIAAAVIRAIFNK